MSIAREIAENIHDFSNLEIIDVPVYQTKRDNKDIFSFLDCSILIIEKEKEKAFISERRLISDVKEKHVNPEQSFFYKNNAILKAILTSDNETELNDNSLYVLTLNIIKEEKIKLGFNKLHIVNNGLCFGEQSAGKKHKILKENDSLFKKLNIDPKLIKNVLNIKLKNKKENNLSLDSFLNSKLNDEILIQDKKENKIKNKQKKHF